MASSSPTARSRGRPTSPGTYNLIDSGSIPIGSLGTSTSGTIDGWPANIAIQGDNVVLNVVPEPGTLVLLAAGAFSVLGYGWTTKATRSTNIRFRRKRRPATLSFPSRLPEAMRRAA